MLDESSIEKRLSESVSNNAPTEEIDGLVSILNGIQDYKKKSYDSANYRKTALFEYLKSFSAIVVPFLTLLTLAITVFFQWDQAKITTRANEDAQWRAVIDSITKAPSPTTDIVITTALVPFYDPSSRYRTQAYEMTFLLAGRVSSRVGFESLYRSAFGDTDWNNASDIHRLDASLQRAFSDMDEAFDVMGGADRLAELAKNPKQSINLGTEMNIYQVNHARNELLEAQNFLSTEVASLLRKPRPSGSLYSDFSNFQFFETDLNSTDFSGLNIESADFQRCNVLGANLSPEKFLGSSWPATAWWEAKDISAPLIEYLIDNASPDFKGDDQITLENTDVVVKKTDYKKRLTDLCAQAKANCQKYLSSL